MMLNVNELIGFGAGATGGNIEFITSGTSTASTITIPALSDVGDLAILFDRGRGASAPPDVVPSGFTKIDTRADSLVRQSVSYKKLLTGDSGSSITGLSASAQNDKLILIFRNIFQFATLEISNIDGEITEGDPAQQVKAATNAPSLVLGFGGAFTAVTFNTFSPSPDQSFTFSNTVSFGRISYLIQNTLAAQVTIDIADISAANCLQSFRVKP